MSWKSVKGALRYRIYSFNKETGTYTKIADTTDLKYTISNLSNGTKYTAKKLSSGTDYTYLVRAYNGNSWSSYTLDDVVSSRTYCSSPKVTAKGGNKNITLNWKSVKGATKYRIYKYNTSTRKYTSIGTTTGNKYTVNGLKYTYLIRAYNGMSYSSYTSKNRVSATVK